LAAYRKEKKYLLASIKSLEMKPEEPEEQRAMSFIDGLDRRKYHTLQVDLMNRPTEMPKTLAAAYDRATNWVVTVSRTAESYVSDHSYCS
jgi:hypothetical protein